MAEECGVMVGVRIRPFNEREKNLNAKLCVDMNGPTTILQPVEEGEEEKKFTFDASFWSHDGFENDENGYSVALPGSKYADQAHVFDKFGKAVLDNAWAGYHCCLFAYGQTGAGKSYSMTGYGNNKGIVPQACEEIFRRIGDNPDPNLEFQVTVSMIEIYNEAVQDLLLPPKQRPKGGLKIRESKQLGIYVEGVKKRPVASYEAIDKVCEEGTSNRTVGATLMNATSSRAHTVVVIEFVQVQNMDGVKSEKVSMINLVDLAGSEKAGQTGASGDRLKEGCAINKSLTALGNVIEKLADKSSGKNPKVVIPYRDSQLTRLLQNALGGSSKTIMICAISPASSNHEETLSTLRYADRAKKIKNAAVVNENPQEKMIRELREENEKLKKLYGGDIPAGGDPADMAEKEAEIKALEEQLANMAKSFEDRVREADDEEAAAGQSNSVDLKLPHIGNLNDDQMLTNKLQFAFKEGETTIGRDPAQVPQHQRSDKQPDVVLAGPGLQQEHAVVKCEGGVCKLLSIGIASETTKVNGKNVEGDGVTLEHGDRVAFGSNLFVFIDPAKGTAAELFSSGKVTCALARKEVGGEAAAGRSEEELAEGRKRAEELEKKAKEAEEELQRGRKAKEEAEEALKAREDEYQAKMKEMQEQEKAADEEQEKAHQKAMERLKAEFEEHLLKENYKMQKQMKKLEEQAKKAADEESKNKRKEKVMEKLEDDLEKMMPLVKEANLIAAELGRPHRFETKIQVDLEECSDVDVTAAVLLDGVNLYEWSPSTLENRVFLMRELLEKFEEGGPSIIEGLTKDDDPFWDPIQSERPIGVAQVLMEGLLDQLENSVDVAIMNGSGKKAGTLKVEVWPVGKNGDPGIPDEDVVDDIMGTKMTMLVKVVSAAGLPEDLASDVRVEYDYFLEDTPQQVPPVAGNSVSPEFNYSKTFVQDPVTSRYVDWLKGNLVFRVYGRNAAAKAMEASWGSPGLVPKPPGEPRDPNTPSRGRSSPDAAMGGSTSGPVKAIQRIRNTKELLKEELNHMWAQSGLPEKDEERKQALEEWCMEALNKDCPEGQASGMDEAQVRGIILRSFIKAALASAANKA